MPHQTDLVATIALGLGFAFIFGLMAARLKLPLILGYLIAGFVVGPFSPGFIADMDIATQLSEIGVSLLMFGVGVHFSIKDLLAVRRIAVPGALVQIVAATLLGAVVSRYWGWSWGAGLVFGLCLSVASTVVLIRTLTDLKQMDNLNGRIAVGWLVVEDLVTVVALVLLPAVASFMGEDSATRSTSNSIALSLLVTLGKVAVFAAAMLVIGQRAIPKILGRVARTGSRELFVIGVLAIALGIAFGAAALFGVSPALGAFFAGVVISESDLSYQAGVETRPIESAFTVLFFVAIGMMFDPQVLLEMPLQVLAALGIVMVGKSIAAFLLVIFFRFPISTALVISAALAQIGEFSFILVALGVDLALLPDGALSVVVAAAILSISLNPFVFRTIEPIGSFMRSKNRLMRLLEGKKQDTARSIGIDTRTYRNHVVLVGFGRVGGTIARALLRERIPLLVIDNDLATVEEAWKSGVNALFGDASQKDILGYASLKDARLLVVATPARSHVKEIVGAARSINPKLVICARSHDFEEAMGLRSLGIENIVLGELELALEMVHVILATLGHPQQAIEDTIDEVRSLGVESMHRGVGPQ